MNKELELNLINLAKQKDSNAFSKLFNKYYKTIRYVIYDIVKDDDIADDLTSIAFTKAYYKIETYAVHISFEMWLKTIAVNTAIDHIRRTKDRRNDVYLDDPNNYTQLESEFLNPEEKIAKTESLEQLKCAMNLLRSEYKRILELRYFENMSYEQLADTLKLPMGTVKSTLRNAKIKLLQFYKNISNSN